MYLNFEVLHDGRILHLGSLEVKGQGHGRVGDGRVGAAGGVVAEHADLAIQGWRGALATKLTETTQGRVTLGAFL